MHGYRVATGVWKRIPQRRLDAANATHVSEPAYYTTLKYGKARGHEPVRYVDSIRNYYSLLTQLEPPPVKSGS
jgi:membrane-bound lytic murein transglycosylase MltF